jgi:hypothetical protein
VKNEGNSNKDTLRLDKRLNVINAFANFNGHTERERHEKVKIMDML